MANSQNNRKPLQKLYIGIYWYALSALQAVLLRITRVTLSAKRQAG
jgi:hypothetical protein